MNKVTAPLLYLLFGLLLMANADAQDAKSPLVINSSFESPAVDEGSCSVGVPGWSWTGSPDITVHAVVHPGGSSSREPWPTTPPFGIDGSNFCKLYASANLGTGVLWQDTGIKYQAGATYTLTAAFGLQTDHQMLSPGCTMFLSNSSLTPLGCITIAEANLTAGEFKDQSVTYKATGSEPPGDGAYGAPGDIIVGFWLPPSSPAGSYLDFDNVRLKAPRARRAAPTPAPAAIHAPATSPTPATTPSAETPSYFGNHT